MYESDWDKVKLQFTRNMVIGCNKSKALVINPYKLFESNIHKDIVVSGDEYMLLIDYWWDD